jgi:hypothetical protein
MARVRYNLEQRVFIYDCYVEIKTHTNHGGENFTLNFLTTCLSGDTISKLVKKVRTNIILLDRELLKRNRVLTEEKPDISHRSENSPQKSLQRLPLQGGVSVCRELVKC